MKKIKGSVKALHPDIIFVLYAVFTAIAIGIRAYQLMYIFEPDTGFYFLEMKHSLTIPLLYALVAASALLFLLLSYLSAKQPQSAAPTGKNFFMATGSVLFSVTLVITGMLNFSSLYNSYISAASASVKEFLINSKSVPQVFEVLFALLSALYFVIVAVSYFSGNGAFRSSKVMSLTPVCWLMCRLISRFVRAVSFIHVSELFWELMMIVCLMIFFMGFARIMSDVDANGKFPITMGIGLCGSMLAFMIVLSRIITYIFAGDVYLSSSSPIELCDFGAGVMICMFLLSCVHDLQPKETPVPPVKASAPTPIPHETPTVLINNDEEAFRIAEQYANRYITEEPIIKTQTAVAVEEEPKE